jgi:hypothetical protein
VTVKTKTRLGATHLRKVAAALLCGALVACASGGGGSASRTHNSRSPITREEIGDRGALDLYTVVQQLRPNWLQNRGQATPLGGVRTVRVAIDGRLQPGSAEVLRSLRGSEVQELRYLSGQDAQTRFGMDTEGGVIVVTTNRGGGAAEGS